MNQREIPLAQRLHPARTWALISLQLAVASWAAWMLSIETELHLPQLLVVLFAGFSLQPLVPSTWRVPYYLLVTAAGLTWFLGPVNAGIVAGMGSLVAAIASSSWPLRIRITLVGLLMAGLAIIVAWAPPWSLPHFPAFAVLGSMFVFRLVLFLYERSTGFDPGSRLREAAYFFMLPNMALTLFPAIDLRNFSRNVPEGSEWAVYKRGVQWIALGLFHLMAYRLVYHYLLRQPESVSDSLSYAHYAFSNYILIMRLTGILHIGVGSLCLFGFDLPSVFNNYFLAEGFSDLWRRINTYFREFMLKVFYYPVFFRIRHWGIRKATAVTILFLFFISWQFHSLQWFWLKGRFPVRAVDAVFWGLFGLLIMWNALSDLKRGRTETPETPWKAAALRAARIVGMLAFMSVLWSLWSAPTLTEWWRPLSKTFGSSVAQWAALMGIIGLAWAMAWMALLADRRWNLSGFFNPEPESRMATFWSASMLLGIGLIALPHSILLGRHAGFDLEPLRSGRLNEADQLRRIEGYYSEILRGNDLLDPLSANKTNEVREFTDGDIRMPSNDFRHVVKRPGVKTTFKGESFTVNRWGMRDKDYPLEKPNGSVRFLILGGSFALGSGVSDQDVFDAVMEEQMNSSDGKRMELLNFATASYDLVDGIIQFEKERLERFQGDHLVFISHGLDIDKTLRDMARWHNQGQRMPYSFMQDAVDRAGLTPGMSDAEVAKALAPFGREIVRKAYGYLYDLGLRHGMEPVWVYWPTIIRRPSATNEKDLVRGMVSELGYRVIDLEKVYGTYSEEELTVSNYDMHPNPFAHQLIADSLSVPFRSLLQR